MDALSSSRIGCLLLLCDRLVPFLPGGDGRDSEFWLHTVAGDGQCVAGGFAPETPTRGAAPGPRLRDRSLKNPRLQAGNLKIYGLFVRS